MSSLDDKIKEASEFMQLWVRYHRVYEACLNKTQTTKDDEELLRQIRQLAGKRYESLKNNLGLEGIFDNNTSALVDRLLFIDSIIALSDNQISRINEDWSNSYNTFNRLLADLQNKRAQARGVKPVDKIKKFFTRGVK